ncbi:hypothetical protein UY3_17430 [Chelonia mydas]|uniref:Uncharacterized protein n=1 Tax=Chelonia mydas TaxID=8469 RepID=M7AK44_CHEMY|nr:hypothetical protein UY3_17430 [Chelonia mydas]
MLHKSEPLLLIFHMVFLGKPFESLLDKWAAGLFAVEVIAAHHFPVGALSVFCWKATDPKCASLQVSKTVFQLWGSVPVINWLVPSVLRTEQHPDSPAPSSLAVSKGRCRISSSQ